MMKGNTGKVRNNWEARQAAKMIQKKQRRKNNRLARKNRRLNLRRGKVAGNQ